MKVRYEDRALVQIEAIRDWYAPPVGDAGARAIVRELFDRCDALVDSPRRGSPCEDIRRGLRTIPHRGMFTIGYRVDGDVVTILGITGRGQSLEALTGDCSCDMDLRAAGEASRASVLVVPSKRMALRLRSRPQPSREHNRKPI